MVQEWIEWDKFQTDINYSSEAFKEMMCIQKFHLTLEYWEDISREKKLKYLYAMTMQSEKEKHELETLKNKGGQK